MMLTAQWGTVVRDLRQRAAGLTENQPTDDELLRAFLARGDSVAFEAILQRHGPLVLRICRRVLGGLHDAEDAFQATFLFLAQQAGSVRKSKSLASWLHGVARRMAANARRSAARRTRHERQADPPLVCDPARQAAWREVQSILDEEIQHLPENYREPLVRCCLEHRSCAEVAVHLGLQEPAVRARLSRARKLLAQRLSRRGVSLTLLSVALAVSGGRSVAGVPPALRQATVEAATRLAAAQGPTARAVSAPVVALLQGVSRTMVLAKLSMVLVLLATVLLGAGWALVSGRGLPAESGEETSVRPPASVGQAAAPRTGRHTDPYGDPLPDEARARLGTTRFRPGEHTMLVRFTPDAAKLVTQSGSGLRVWDAASGRELRRFGPAGGMAVYGGDLSADGKVAITGDSTQRGCLRLWDVETGRQLREFSQAGPFSLVRLAPDGKTVAVVGSSGVLELWDATTGERSHTLKGHDGFIWSAAFSANSKTLVSGGADQTIRFWEVATGQEVRRIAGCPEVVGAVILSPDGKLCASVGNQEVAVGQGITGRLPDSRARLWDIATGKEVRSLEVGVPKAPLGARTGFTALAFAPDSKTLVTVGMDCLLRVWDVKGKIRRAVPDCSTNAGALAVAPDGKSVAIVNGGTALRIVDLATGKDRVPLAGHGGGVYATAITPDGRTVFTAGGDETVFAWDMATGREVRRLHGHKEFVSALVLSPDGWSLYTLGGDRTLRVWDVASGKERQRLAGDFEASALRSLALSPDGKLLAAERARAGLVLLDATSGKPVHAAGLKGRSCCGAGFTPDGRTLVAWTDDQAVHDLDVATGKLRKQFRLAGDEDRRLSYIAELSPDGRLLAFGSQTRFLSIQEVDTGKEVVRFDRLPDGVSSVAFSPDGRTLAWGGWNDPTVHLIELSTRQERHHFRGHQGRILTLQFSPDGRSLISGGNDATALVWDLVRRADPRAADNKDLSTEELTSLWKDLGTAGAPQAYQSLCRLARSPAAVEFLRVRIQPVAPPDARVVARLIADLDSNKFSVRDKATKELERLGEQAVGACQKALSGALSLEKRQRLETLLARQAAEKYRPSAERVRFLRALEAVEWAGTVRARALLAELAKGAPGAWLTEEAKAAQERLDRRKFTP
jgi:RNA polymerase sigma factor (sigma-70 family)